MIRNLAKIFSGILLFTGLAHGAAFQFGGLRLDAIKVTSSGSATALTKADRQVRITTGSSGDVQKLPNATTLQAGYWFTFINESTGTLTVSDSSSTALVSLARNQSATLVVTSTSTSGGPWSIFRGWDGSSGANLLTFRAASISTGGSGTINYQGPVTWVGSLTRNGAGDVTINVTGSPWSGSVWCTCSTANGNSYYCAMTTVSTSSVRSRVFDASGAAQDDTYHVMCGGT